MSLLGSEMCIGVSPVDLWVADTTFERVCAHIKQVPQISPYKAEIPSEAAVVWIMHHN